MILSLLNNIYMFAHFCQTQTSSWRQELSFPRPSKGCPAGTEISDCTRSSPVQCRCEPKDLATLLPTILKGEEMSGCFKMKLSFRRPAQGCPYGTYEGWCRKGSGRRLPQCYCKPSGIDSLYALLMNKGETRVVNPPFSLDC